MAESCYAMKYVGGEIWYSRDLAPDNTFTLQALVESYPEYLGGATTPGNDAILTAFTVHGRLIDSTQYFGGFTDNGWTMDSGTAETWAMLGDHGLIIATMSAADGSWSWSAPNAGIEILAGAQAGPGGDITHSYGPSSLSYQGSANEELVSAEGQYSSYTGDWEYGLAPVAGQPGVVVGPATDNYYMSWNDTAYWGWPSMGSFFVAVGNQGTDASGNSLDEYTGFTTGRDSQALDSTY